MRNQLIPSARNLRRACRRLAAGLSLTCVLTGCATWSQHGVTASSGKLRIAVLPVRNDVAVRNLSDICTPPATAGSNDQTALIEAEMHRVTSVIRSRIETGLCESRVFEVIPDSQVDAAIDKLNIEADAQPPAPSQVLALGRALGADVVLATRISGYGRIKSKWLALLVGSGLVEGVVQGGVAAYAVGNVWVAIGVAAEEMLQEILTWGGGAWLFNRVFTPVILETDLLGTADGQAVWTDTSMARINRKALKDLPESDRTRREVRLQKTAEAAVDDLLNALNKKASRSMRQLCPETLDPA